MWKDYSLVLIQNSDSAKEVPRFWWVKGRIESGMMRAQRIKQKLDALKASSSPKRQCVLSAAIKGISPASAETPPCASCAITWAISQVVHYDNRLPPDNRSSPAKPQPHAPTEPSLPQPQTFRPSVPVAVPSDTMQRDLALKLILKQTLTKK